MTGEGDATMTADFFLRAGIFVRTHPDKPMYAVLDDGTWVRA